MDAMEFKVEILKKEMDITGTKVNHFDNSRLRTRQIAIAIWTAVIGFGLKEGSPTLFLLAALLPIPFWIIEARYRRYQRGWNLRLRAVRDFIRDGKYTVLGENEVTLSDFLGNNSVDGFPMIDFWARRTVPEEEHKKETGHARNFFNPTLLMLYPSMTSLGILAFLFRSTLEPSAG